MRAFGVNSVIAGVLWLCLLLGSVCSAGEAIGDVIDVQPGESIQAAIDAAPNGATIRIASGEYEEHLTIRKEITLIGSADPEAPTVLAAPSLYPVITFLEEAEAVLESLHVVATTRFETDAVAVYGSADVVIRGVEVRGSRGNGINVHSTGRIEIVGCAIHSNQRFAIVVQTSGATVFGGNNDLRGNGAELGRFAPPTLRTPLAAQTESTYVQVPVDYPTVQAAIDAVAPGGTVEVASGSFSEALTIWKRLTLLGHGDTTELDAPDEALYGGVVLNSAQSISLERVAFGRAWTICGGTALLRDVDVSCRDDVGIELERRAAASLHSVRVQGVHGPGLLVATDSSALLEDCTFAECYDGILVEDRGHVEATACAFESCRVSGLSVASREATATVQECSFLDNADGVSSPGAGGLRARRRGGVERVRHPGKPRRGASRVRWADLVSGLRDRRNGGRECSLL